MKKICLFLWRMLYPLLLYELVADVISLAVYVRWPGAVEEWELVWSSVAAVIAGGILMLMYRSWRGNRLRALEDGAGETAARPEPFGRAGKFDVSSVILLVQLGVCLCVIFNTILLELPISWDDFEAISDAFYDPPVSIQLICSGLVIPLTEELVFRGMGYYKMRSMLPAFPCILLSAIYFGVFHGNVTQGIYAGILGMALAWVMEWYGTLAAPYLVHATANMTSVLLSNTVLGVLVEGFRPVRLAVVVICAVWLFKIMKDIRRDGIPT
jgi:membrane protease YdiL (CAAX protease family)